MGTGRAEKPRASVAPRNLPRRAVVAVNDGLAERRAIRLDARDMVAGAQILSWIALPHRPAHGVALLNHWYWARRRFRKEGVPALPFTLKKLNRIEGQLQNFNARVSDAFLAGVWLQRRSFSALPGEGGPIASMLKAWGASTKSQAQRRAVLRGTAQSQEIRDIWSRRKPVLHLAWAAGETLADRYHCEGRQGFDLERTVFWPDWVPATIDRAEQIASQVCRFGAFDPGQFHRFHRDSF